MRNSEDFVYFVLVNPTNASYGFNGYSDRKGNDCFVANGFDEYGNPRRKRFKFTKSKRTIWIAKEREEEIEFLRNSPECEGSPNGSYLRDGTQTGVMFKELNDEYDAQIGIDHEMVKIEAKNIAIKLKGDELNEIAALCGSFNGVDSIKKFHVLKYADNNPEDFLRFVKSPDREARSLVRKAIQGSVFNLKGFMYLYGDAFIGKKGDEDGMVEKVMSDENLKNAIKKDLENISK